MNKIPDERMRFYILFLGMDLKRGRRDEGNKERKTGDLLASLELVSCLRFFGYLRFIMELLLFYYFSSFCLHTHYLLLFCCLLYLPVLSSLVGDFPYVHVSSFF